jgi:thioredoxin reductase
MYDNLPEIAGLPDCFGISVHHCPYCDAFEYGDQRIFSVGNDAAKAAGLGLSLRTWSSRITVLTNGERVADDDRQNLERCGVAWREEPVLRLDHEEGRLRAVELANGLRLEGEALFFNTDHRQQSGLAAMIGLSFDEESTANTSEKQQSRIPGLFLAGDIDGDVQFVIVAAAEGATAAVAINRELQDEDQWA